MKAIIIGLIFTFLFSNMEAQTKEETSKPTSYLSVYPLFVVKKNHLESTKKFYTLVLDMQIVFESTWFVLLQARGQGSMYLAFMADDHPSSPPTIPAMTAESGVCVTFQVEDSRSVYERMLSEGVKVYYPLKEEAWGQRRFGLLDPNGMYIDIVQQTQPQEGYWDQYMIK